MSGRRSVPLLLGMLLVLGLLSTIFPLRTAQAATTTDLPATDDTYVRGGSFENDNYGSLNTLMIKDGPDSANTYDRRTFLKFDLSSLGAVAVTSATLRFTVTAIEQGATNAPLRVVNTTDGWTEAALTWRTQPTLGSELVKNMTANPGLQMLDVTAYVRDQISGDDKVSFVLLDTTTFNRSTSIASTESGANVPTLRVTTDAEPPLLIPTNPQKSAGTFFQIPCPPSHRSNDDPIVFPGIDEATHEHQFFANTTTNEASTQTSLLNGGTTCTREPLDTAAYWAPTLYDSAGQLQSQRRVRAYYMTHANTTHRPALQSFPPGLRIIAGNARATAAQPSTIIEWICRNRTNQGAELALKSSNPPTCESYEYLALVIHFPNCLARYSDGTPMLDSSDHRRHMTYANTDQACPASHPIRVPKLRLSLIYETPGYSGGSFTLGGRSGEHHALPWYAMHADFWNSWNQAQLDRYVNECLKRASPPPGAPALPAGCDQVLN